MDIDGKNLEISDTIASALKEYGSLDWSSGDLVLKFAGGTVPAGQTIEDAFGGIVKNAGPETISGIYEFLDSVLVLNEDFAAKYRGWVGRLSALQDKIDEMNSASLNGILPRLHVGYIFVSATDSSEKAVRSHFGDRTRWKRIADFLIGTKYSQEIGSTGGLSCVALNEDNMPDHSHHYTVKTGSGEYTWNSGSAPETVQTEKALSPGSKWGSKNVYVEAAAPGMSDNAATGLYPTPHSNVPPYRNVFVWECVSLGEEPEQEVSGISSRGETPFDEIAEETLTVPDSLEGMTANDGISFIGSDELQAGPERFDSVQIPLPAVAEALARTLFDEKMDTRKRYLLKTVYAYLLGNLQDRMFAVLKNLRSALDNPGETRIRVFPGQYIFVYGDCGSSSEEEMKAYISRHYCVDPSSLSRISGVFLRGTTTFTPETLVDLYRYASPEIVSTLPAPAVAGGEDSVTLRPSDFPVHSHNPALVSSLNSVQVRENSYAYGGNGAFVRKDDVRFTGTSGSMKNGAGEYEFTVNPIVNDHPGHWNIPRYKQVNVFVVG